MSLIPRSPKREIDAKNDNHNRNPSNQLQIVAHSTSRFKVPGDWLVDARPRLSNPAHTDKYYTEPHTGLKFRSLVSVQRYLSGETSDCLATKMIISKNKNTIVSHSASRFNLPDDWLVDIRPRLSDPSHIDRYYIEPHTGQKFRSLVSVQRYLSGETSDYLPTKMMISKNKNTTCIKSRTAQKFLSARDFEGGLTELNECRPTPKLVFKCGSGKRSAPSAESCHNTVKKRYSVAEDQTTIKPSNQSRKINVGEDDRGSIHNLTEPPTKVSWVLSGAGGSWSPFLDDSVVPASEKVKWSEAFSISINESY